MKLEDRLPDALARIADSISVRDPGTFEPDVITVEVDRGPSGPSRRVLLMAAAIVILGIAGLAAVASRPAANGPADEPPSSAGPAGALILPESTGMTVEYVQQGALAGESELRWYATEQAQPERATYLRLFSYENGVPAGQSLGCLLAEPSRDATLDDGTSVCLEVRDASEPFGRIAIDRSPYSVVIEGDATDDELLTAGLNVVASAAGDGFEIGSGGLPEGVVPTGAGRNVSDFAATGTNAADDPMVQVNWKGADGRSIFYVATADDAAFVSNLRLGFESVSDLTVHGVPGFIRTIEGEPTYRGIVWHENGVTYQVGSQQLTSGELLALVEQLRPATATEWAAMVAAAGVPLSELEALPATTAASR